MVPERIRRLDNRGFNLAELVIVTAVIGILFALGLPFFVSYWQSARVRAGAQEVRAALQQAKQLAITTRQSICVQAGTNGYQFRQGGCSGTAWIGPGTDGTGNFRLQNNVTLSGASPVFTALGAAAPGGTLTVTGPNGSTLTVTVAGAGRITIP